MSNFVIGQRVHNNDNNIGTILWIGKLNNTNIIGFKDKRSRSGTISFNNLNNDTITDTTSITYPPEVQSALSSTGRDGSPAEVIATSVPLAVEASSNYQSLKSKATPGDRGEGDGSGGEVGSEDVTSSGSGIPGSDLRELEGEVNKEADGRTGPQMESCLQEEDKVVTLGEGMESMMDKSLCLYDVLGIEWDGMFIGDHNGMGYFESGRLLLLELIKDELYNVYGNIDIDIMNLLNKFNNSCSLVYINDINIGISFNDAIIKRYIYNESDNELNGDGDNYINGDKKIEFVGKSDAIDFYNELSNLYIIDLSSYMISIINNNINYKFPRVGELYLNNNLLYKLSDIIPIISILSNLEILDLSGNLFKFDSWGKLFKFNMGLKYLSLNYTMISLDYIFRLVDYNSDNIISLSLCNNYYYDLKSEIYPTNLTSLDLSGNYIWNWYSIFNLIFQCFNLKKLNLSNNKLKCTYIPHGYEWGKGGEYGGIYNNTVDIYNDIINLYSKYSCNIEENSSKSTPYDSDICEDKKHHMPHNSLHELNLDDNYISDWIYINMISYIFINLKSLRLKLNTIEHQSSSNIDRQVLISLFPNLQVLNGSEITKTERINAERYYIMLADKDSKLYNQTSMSYGNNMRHIDRLRSIHYINEEKSTTTISKITKLIKLQLIPDGDSDSLTKDPIFKKLPPTATIRDVKIICSKHFKIKLDDLILLYNDGVCLYNRKFPTLLEVKSYSSSTSTRGRLADSFST